MLLPKPFPPSPKNTDALSNYSHYCIASLSITAGERIALDCRRGQCGSVLWCWKPRKMVIKGILGINFVHRNFLTNLTSSEEVGKWESYSSAIEARYGDFEPRLSQCQSLCRRYALPPSSTCGCATILDLKFGNFALTSLFVESLCIPIENRLSLFPDPFFSKISSDCSWTSNFI